MTSWSIDGVETRTILDITEAEFWEFEQSAAHLSGVVEAVIASLPDTQTASALETFLADPMLITMMAASEHAHSAVWGTRAAVDAYDAGQEQMAIDAEVGLEAAIDELSEEYP